MNNLNFKKIFYSRHILYLHITEDINYSKSDFQEMGMRELRKLAAKLNVKRYQSLRKQVVIEKSLIK